MGSRAGPAPAQGGHRPLRLRPPGSTPLESEVWGHQSQASVYLEALENTLDTNFYEVSCAIKIKNLKLQESVGVNCMCKKNVLKV